MRRVDRGWSDLSSSLQASQHANTQQFWCAPSNIPFCCVYWLHFADVFAVLVIWVHLHMQHVATFIYIPCRNLATRHRTLMDFVWLCQAAMCCAATFCLRNLTASSMEVCVHLVHQLIAVHVDDDILRPPFENWQPAKVQNRPVSPTRTRNNYLAFTSPFFNACAKNILIETLAKCFRSISPTATKSNKERLQDSAHVLWNVSPCFIAHIHSIYSNSSVF